MELSLGLSGSFPVYSFTSVPKQIVDENPLG